ncbi:MAG TPA: DUF2934 domain-containing protein [Bryobacteraceae bacterium]|nr:DUF2934 domain-containing protein [Bryobacteraceae bacterium]
MARKQNQENERIASSGIPIPKSRRTASAARPKHSPTSPETAAAFTDPVADPPSAATITETAPERSEIARLAYSFWEARGCQGGSPEEDWLRAEQELQKRTVVAQ